MKVLIFEVFLMVFRGLFRDNKIKGITPGFLMLAGRFKGILFVRFYETTTQRKYEFRLLRPYVRTFPRIHSGFMLFA